jgi:hypothetical protein
MALSQIYRLLRVSHAARDIAGIGMAITMDIPPRQKRVRRQSHSSPV